MPDPVQLNDVRDLLTRPKTMAVLGAHDNRARAAFYVPEHFFVQGWRVLPVNPTKRTRTLWDQQVVGHLADIDEPVHLVDVFRRAEHLPDHVDDILALEPRVVWFQLGIRHDDVAEQLRDAGIRVVQDRCMLADHKALGLG